MSPTPSPGDWKDVLEFVRTQTKNDWDRFDRLFKYTAGAISLITIVATTVLFYLVGHSLSEAREEMNKITSVEVEHVRSEVRARIEHEFQTPQIADVVRSVAREKATAELNRIIREEVARQVELAVKREEPTIQSIVATQTGTRITKALQPLDATLSGYQQGLHTAMLATTAMAGSRAALADLRSATGSQDQNIRDIATWAIGAIGEEDLASIQNLNPELTPEQLSGLLRSPYATLRQRASSEWASSRTAGTFRRLSKSSEVTRTLEFSDLH